MFWGLSDLEGKKCGYDKLYQKSLWETAKSIVGRALALCNADSILFQASCVIPEAP